MHLPASGWDMSETIMKYDEKQITEQLSDPKTQRQAFGMLVNQYSETLYWKIRRIVLTHDDANDVLQNAFLKAWSNIDDFQNKSKISTWLYRIAINEALDFVRREKNKISADEDISVANRLMADDYFDGDEAQALLQEAISLLPDVQRTVFTLRYYENMRYSEMSKVLNTSEGALKASYHIAVQKISDYFHKHD
jgi:RNA polymerase sigma-70 factor (ECF subfamily)